MKNEHPHLNQYAAERRLTSVKVCIVYIESCGWKLRSRARGYYFFYNENAPIGMRDKTFSLKELRETYKTGW